MINVTSNFKDLTKKIKQQNCKIQLKETNNELEKKEVKYGFEGQLFKTIMKQIIVKVAPSNELKGKNLNFQYGLYVNNQFEYVDLGDFYIKDEPEANKGAEEVEITAYDKMVSFMKTFKQSELNITYPCSLLVLIQKMCDVCGVNLYSTDFFNSNLSIEEDYFTAQQITYRDVLDKVAQATLTTIIIKDNKLYLVPISSNPVEILDRSYLSKLVITDKFGPVNALVLGRGDVEDNVEAKDDTSITQNGRCEIRFDENEFVEFKREQVINSMFEKIKGLTYYAFEASDIGVMWLDPADCIALKDSETDIYNSYYLDANITINTGIKSTTQSSIPEETETEYKVTTEEEKKYLKVERLAKKNEGLIQDLIVETGTNSQKITKIEQDIDGIDLAVSSMEEEIKNIGTTTVATGDNIKIDASENPAKLKLYGKTEQIVTEQSANLADVNVLYKEMEAFNNTDLSEKVVDGKNCIEFYNTRYRGSSGFKGLQNIKYKENTQYTIRGLFRISDTQYTSDKALYMNIHYTDGTADGISNNAQGETWTEFRVLSNSSKTVSHIAFSYGTGRIMAIR